MDKICEFVVVNTASVAAAAAAPVFDKTWQLCLLLLFFLSFSKQTEKNKNMLNSISKLKEKQHVISHVKKKRVKLCLFHSLFFSFIHKHKHTHKQSDIHLHPMKICGIVTWIPALLWNSRNREFKNLPQYLYFSLFLCYFLLATKMSYCACEQKKKKPHSTTSVNNKLIN